MLLFFPRLAEVSRRQLPHWHSVFLSLEHLHNNKKQCLIYLHKTFLNSVETQMDRKPTTSSNSHRVSVPSFKHLTPVPEALRIVFSNLPKKAFGVENVPLSSALGRILAQDVISQVDIPSFERAAMDGFAVIAEDTYGATPAAPVSLRTIGAVQIGTVPTIRIGRGEAASIATGGQMPQGANAVVMVEYTKKREDGTVEISDEVRLAENVTRIGEDVQRDTTVLRKGVGCSPKILEC